MTAISPCIYCIGADGSFARKPNVKGRVDIYDQFVGLWLDREIRKGMASRGVATASQQLRLEVRVACQCDGVVCGVSFYHIFNLIIFET